MLCTVEGRVVEILAKGFLLENGTTVSTQNRGASLGLAAGDYVRVSGGPHNGVFASAGVSKTFPDGSAVEIPANRDELGRWRELDSGFNSGQFAISFPMIPVYSAGENKSEHRFHTISDGGRLFLQFSYETNFDDSISIAERFGQMAKMPNVCSRIDPVPITINHRILINEGNVWFSKDVESPGMEADFERRDGQNISRIKRHIYRVEHRDCKTLYQLTAERINDRSPSYRKIIGMIIGSNAQADVEKFFSSFKLH